MRNPRYKFSRPVRDIPEYVVWTAMKQRCQNKNCIAWPRYGGRGIKVCRRWQTFNNFFIDMGPRPTHTHQLDRYPNNNGNYEPTNCRWTSRKFNNNRNRRDNRPLTCGGRTHLLIEWAEILSLPRETIAWRLRNGWSTVRALATPSRPTRQYRRRTKRMRFLKVGKRIKTLAEWSYESGVSEGTIRSRLKLGWSPRQAIFGRI